MERAEERRPSSTRCTSQPSRPPWIPLPHRARRILGVWNPPRIKIECELARGILPLMIPPDLGVQFDPPSMRHLHVRPSHVPNFASASDWLSP
jgi:hypothetical protein